jgi:hypothetical protein
MTSEWPELQSEEREWIEAARDWVKGHFAESADEKYSTIEGKLRVISTILRQGWVESSEKWKLQSLGIAFGDALSQRLMLEWVTVDDEHGRCPALNWPGTSVLCYPLTMISKRVEDEEEVDVDVQQLFEGISARITELAFSGRID